MEHVSILLLGGTVVTMNDAYDVYNNGGVAIRDHEIVAVGSRDDIESAYSAETVIDCSGQYVMPGLINAHTHVPMTLLRGLADDLRLDVWLMGYVMPVEREFVNTEFVKLGTRLACAEMIRGGVTTFSDMYYFESDIAEEAASAGMRALVCESILKFPSPDAQTFEDSLAYTREFIEKWHGHDLITPSIAPHAPYSTTADILKRCRDLADEFDIPLMIHIAETRREVDDSLEQFGKTVVPWVKDTGLFEVPSIAAHCVHIDEHEIRMLRKHGVSVAHCPSANLKLASGIAPVSQMLEFGVNVAIGTDGPASNNDLDMFEEMRLAALLAKVTPQNPVAVPARQALTMATRNGAKALGLDAVTGSLEAGKYADVIMVDANPIHNSPHFDVTDDNVYSQIVYAAKSSDVRHTIIHGRVLMRDHKLQSLDVDAIKQEAREYAREVGTFLSQREENPLSKLVAVGVDVEQSESFEVQLKANLNDPSAVEELLSNEFVEVMRSVHYRQYDTYFLFNDSEGTRVRYREDDRIDNDGNVSNVRMRLTYTTGEKERIFHDTVVLSHSRYIAPAAHPLRFYQEYFHATEERSLQKERRRWRILYKGSLFFINVDRLLEPDVPQMYIEIKSRTWSKTDAENKANMIQEMLEILELASDDVVREDYLEM